MVFRTIARDGNAPEVQNASLKTQVLAVSLPCRPSLTAVRSRCHNTTTIIVIESHTQYFVLCPLHSTKSENVFHYLVSTLIAVKNSVISKLWRFLVSVYCKKQQHCIYLATHEYGKPNGKQIEHYLQLSNWNLQLMRYLSNTGSEPWNP